MEPMVHDGTKEAKSRHPPATEHEEPHVTVMQRKMHAALEALGSQRTEDQDELFAHLENLRRDELAREEDAAWAQHRRAATSQSAAA